MRLLTRVGLLLAVGILSVALVNPRRHAAASGGTLERIDVATGGTPGDVPTGWRNPGITADGRFVVFASDATNLVPGDTNGNTDVFIRDRQAGTTERASVTSTGAQVDGQSHFPSISADGRFVSFYSNGNVTGTFVPGIYVRDREAGTTEIVSLGTTGNIGNQPANWENAISADGRFVVFESWATDLVPGDSCNPGVYVRDRQLATTQRVDITTAGAPACPDGSANPDTWMEPAISGDGLFVAFDSARPLAPGTAGVPGQVFVRDRDAGTTALASITTTGEPAADAAGSPDLTSDGRFVAFVSNAANFLPTDSYFQSDIFVHDSQTGMTERVSVDSAGNPLPGTDGSYSPPRISADGRFVSFGSDAPLARGDDNNGYDVYVHDRKTGRTARASTGAGSQQYGFSALSADGRYAVFTGIGGLYLRDLGASDADSEWDLVDNCPTVANEDQLNTDGEVTSAGRAGFDTTNPAGDDLGDACDPDKDGDGLPNTSEGVFPVPGCPSATGPTDPLNPDTDGDGVLDGVECSLGSNPVSAASRPAPAACADPDGDGIPSAIEVRGWGTDPDNANSDGDARSDDAEIMDVNGDGEFLVFDQNFDLDLERAAVNGLPPFDTGPLTAQEKHAFDLNRDGAVNLADAVFLARLQHSLPACDTSGDPDLDGDGYSDPLEEALGKDPMTYCATMRADVNSDAVVNLLDLARVALDFGQAVPPADARYDQNADNVVNLLDLGLQAQSFSKNVSSCP